MPIGASECKPASIPERKLHPYLPDKPGRHLDNLNGKVLVAPRNAVPPATKQLVYCRHIADRYHQFKGRKREFFEEYMQDRAQVELRFDSRLDEVQASFRNEQSAEELCARRMISPENLGIYLRDVASQLRVADAPSADIVFLTHKHVLAGWIAWKRDEGVEESWRVRVGLYEPNVSGNHFVFEAEMPAN